MTESPSPLDGHIYVVEHPTGLVKVGMTANPTKRLATIDRDSRRLLGGPLVAAWVSPPHRLYKENERTLIAECAGTYGRHSAEYFLAPFDEVLTIAQSLSFDPATAEEVAEYEQGLQRRLAALKATFGWEAPKEPVAEPRWHEPGLDGSWRVARPDDDPTVIRLSAEYDLPFMDLAVHGVDGHMTPSHALRVAAELIGAAMYATECRKVEAP